MSRKRSAADVYRARPGKRTDLADRPTRDDALFDGDKTEGKALLDAMAREIAGLQQHLFADDRHRLLVVLQGMDAAGKSSTIRDVFRYANPLGVHATSFRRPSDEELQRDYLWRIHRHTPRRGEIVIMDRSHYEDLTTVRVLGLVDDDHVERRYRHVNAFEAMLADEGTSIVKCWLHLSPEEQAEQLLERLDDDTKNWKFNPSDLDARAAWDDYQRVWSDAITATTTEHAPWYVVPADRRWYRKLTIATIVRDALAALDLRWPDGEVTGDDVERWRAELAPGG